MMMSFSETKASEANRNYILRSPRDMFVNSVNVIEHGGCISTTPLGVNTADKGHYSQHQLDDRKVLLGTMLLLLASTGFS